MGDWELIRAVLASRDTDEQYQRVNTDCSSRFLLTSYHDIAQPRFVLWLRGRPLLTGNHDIVQPRFLMASNHIAQLSMQLLPDGIIDKPPSPSDKPGFFYEFLILEDDEDEDEDTDVVKLGRAVHPLKRRRQWARQCRGQRQRWQFCWKVPFTAKFARGLVTVSGEETKSRRMSEAPTPTKPLPPCTPATPVKTKCWNGFYPLERGGSSRTWRLAAGQDVLTRATHAETLVTPRSVVHALLASAAANPLGFNFPITELFFEPLAPMARRRFKLEPRKITPVQIFFALGPKAHSRRGSSLARTRAPHAETLVTARRVVRVPLAAAAPTPSPITANPTFWVDKGGRKRGAPRTKVWRMPTSGWDGPLCRATYGCGCSPTNTTSGHTSPPTKTMCRRVSEPTKAMCGRVREPTKATSGRGCSPTKEGRGRVFGETKGGRSRAASRAKAWLRPKQVLATSGHTSPPTKTTPEHSCSPTKAMCGRVCIWGDKGGTKSGRLKGKGVVTSRARRRTGGMIAQQWRRPGVVLATSGRSSSDVRAYFSADKDDVQA
ncbi:hypothetical protein B0H17DRAFT_1149777 [Mycena rosella]|uniref:Uncharacterized protein n=1 Tax=Mycena rosella TaxID=1033263 RepID=A0AAD7BY98_MYCRO|nr:hypothetical protein B0H17DRAFT_1149777 [Mycena rosella]